MKTVWAQAHGGSNPSSCAIKKETIFCRFLFYTVPNFEEGFEGGSRFAGAKRFANASCFTKNLTAKDDVDNVGAGRAAKGETLVAFLLEQACSSKEFDFLTQSCSLRSGTLAPTYRRLLISPLKSVINAFLNG